MAQALIHADIAVIGGGLTGKMMALSLLQSGYKILLFAPPAKLARRDTRTTTIHKAGHIMLSTLGVIEHLSSYGANSCDSSCDWPRAPQQSNWLLNWHETPTKQRHDRTNGYVVKNHNLDSAFDKALAHTKFADNLTIIEDSIASFEGGLILQSLSALRLIAIRSV